MMYKDNSGTFKLKNARNDDYLKLEALELNGLRINSTHINLGKLTAISFSAYFIEEILNNDIIEILNSLEDLHSIRIQFDSKISKKKNFGNKSSVILKLLNVECLSLEKFEISNPFKWVEKFVHLKILDMNACSFMNIHASPKLYPELEILTLKNLQFSTWPLFVFQCPNLIFLSLEGNNIFEIPPSVNDLQYLILLDLFNNPIARIDFRTLFHKEMKLNFEHFQPYYYGTQIKRKLQELITSSDDSTDGFITINIDISEITSLTFFTNENLFQFSPNQLLNFVPPLIRAFLSKLIPTKYSRGNWKIHNYPDLIITNYESKLHYLHSSAKEELNQRIIPPLSKLYKKTPLELIQIYINNRGSLSNLELDRLNYELLPDELENLRHKISSDDPIIKFYQKIFDRKEEIKKRRDYFAKLHNKKEIHIDEPTVEILIDFFPKNVNLGKKMLKSDFEHIQKFLNLPIKCPEIKSSLFSSNYTTPYINTFIFEVEEDYQEIFQPSVIATINLFPRVHSIEIRQRFGYPNTNDQKSFVEELGQKAQKLKFVKSLSLDGVTIQDEFSFYGYFSKLESINLTNCPYHTHQVINEKIFEESINIYEKKIPKYDNINSLSWKKSNLILVPLLIFLCPNLENLSIRDNPEIKFLPKKIESLHKLKQIDIQGCFFTRYPFSVCPKLNESQIINEIKWHENTREFINFSYSFYYEPIKQTHSSNEFEIMVDYYNSYSYFLTMSSVPVQYFLQSMSLDFSKNWAKEVREEFWNLYPIEILVESEIWEMHESSGTYNYENILDYLIETKSEPILSKLLSKVSTDMNHSLTPEQLSIVIKEASWEYNTALFLLIPNKYYFYRHLYQEKSSQWDFFSYIGRYDKELFYQPPIDYYALAVKIFATTPNDLVMKYIEDPKQLNRVELGRLRYELNLHELIYLGEKFPSNDPIIESYLLDFEKLKLIAQSSSVLYSFYLIPPSHPFFFGSRLEPIEISCLVTVWLVTRDISQMDNLFTKFNWNNKKQTYLIERLPEIKRLIEKFEEL